MGKLMKYEFRKQLMSKIVVFGVAALLEIIYLLGLIFSNEDMSSIGAGFLILTATVGLFYFSFESIITYSMDLRTKQSYMLFLTPRNMFQVVGAKIVTMILQILGAAAVFIALLVGDVFLLCAKNGHIEQFIEGVKEFIKSFTGVDVRLPELICVAFMGIISWLVFITLAMFAITLSTTLFANKKWKWIVSFVIYFALDFVVSKIASMFIKTGFLEGEFLIDIKEAWCYIAVYVVTLILSYFGTALLLEKKVSV